MANLKWNQDGVLWSDDALIWGDIPKDYPEGKHIFLHALVRIETHPPMLLWTGLEELEYDGATYLGGLGHLGLNIDGISAREGGRASNVTLSIQIGDRNSELRRSLMQPIPSLKASVKMLYSINAKAWHILPNHIEGRLSNPQINDTTFSVEIVSDDLEAFRQPELVWSHEYQQRQYPQDLGFQFARDIAQGLVSAVWPQILTTQGQKHDE